MTKEIPLTKGLVALVDDEDYEWLSEYSWHAYGTRVIYAGRKRGWRKGNATMHRQIMNCPANLEVDHINGDTLDNRRSNLRIATRAQNGKNLPKPRHGTTSTYKGVNWDKTNHRWRADITVDGKRINLGRFNDETIAAAAYDRAARLHHGFFARLNFPEVTV